MARVYLVDGTNLLYRAYHALGGFSTGSGIPTHAVFGFLNMIFRLLKEEKPDSVAVVFDPPGPTLKHDLYADYKANRERTPDDLISQIPYVHRAVKALGLPLVMVEGVEADDVIGTLAKRAVSAGDFVTIVTGDKDFCQLVGPNLRLLDTMRNVSTDPAGVVEKLGVPPEKVIELLALTGDAVDNLPGVPGIGVKTAAKLLEEYKSLEGVLAAAPAMKGKRGEAIVAARERVVGNVPLVTIETELDLNLPEEALKMRPLDRAAAAELFRELEFRKFLADLGPLDQPAPQPEKAPEKPVSQELPAQQGVLNLMGEPPPAPQPALASPVAEPPLEIPPSWAVLYLSGEGVFLLDGQGKVRPLSAEGGLPQGVSLVGHALKSQRELWEKLSLYEADFGFDTELAAYMLNPGRREYPLFDLARERHLPLPSEGDAKAAALLTLQTGAALAAELRKRGLIRLYEDLELPLMPLLARMERTGVKVDTLRLGALSTEYEGRIAELETRMIELVGEPFNPRSTKELAHILFEKLKLPVVRKTATGYSTDAAVLEELSLHHPLPDLLLEHRGLTKLKNSFIDTLPTLVNPADGRIHTDFNQTVAATGRLSSSNPNLQNIPVRGEEGRRIRQAFVAAEGFSLISADYSQIELRILAHMSRDKAMLEIFATGRDIHSETAARLFDVGPFAVTNEMRRQAKVLNFSIIYGVSPFGLARRMGTDQKTAKKMIDSYFARFPMIGGFMESLVKDAENTGESRTLFGRVRTIPDLDVKNRARREAAHRLAINTPIQGTAADIIKIAMLKTEKALREAAPESRLILQVHDELLVEAPTHHVEEVKELVRAAMEGALALDAPLKVEAGHGPDWLTAHG